MQRKQALGKHPELRRTLLVAAARQAACQASVSPHRARHVIGCMHIPCTRRSSAMDSAGGRTRQAACQAPVSTHSAVSLTV